jgi:LysM repeat protein
MSQSIKPRNLALTAVIVICAILGMLVLFAPNGFFNKPASVTQKTPIIQPVPLSTIPAPIQFIEVFIVYKIQKRDTLTKIARNTCGTIDAIVKRNNIKNPDKIYAGKSLTLLKVGTCSPESVKSKTFPEKFTDRTNDGASQGKLFTQPEIGASRSTKQESVQKDVPIKTDTLQSAVNTEDCKNAGSPLRNIAIQTMAIAECIKRNYGALIKEGIATIDGRVSPLEVVARMIVESKGDPFALNKESNCKGLMQLQPGTAKQYGVNLKKIYDPRENIFGGIRVMSDYTYRLFSGNIDRGRVAYNAGPYNKLFRRQNFDPAHFKYVRQVQDVLGVLEAHKFSL